MQIEKSTKKVGIIGKITEREDYNVPDKKSIKNVISKNRWEKRYNK